jgi:hypothetical protein
VPLAAETPLPTSEISGGGEIAGHTWSAYSTTVVTLSALGIGVPTSICEDGWRLRAGAGYWRYERRQEEWLPNVGPRQVTRKRTGSFADLLLGYQASLGALTLKAYAGGIYERQEWSAEERDLWGANTDLSAKVLVESWYNLTPESFAQLDIGWVSEGNTVTARARLGYRVTPTLSVGPELGYWAAAREREPGRDDLQRYGGFVRYEWAGGEASLSAGAMSDDGGGEFYATVNALFRF